MYTAEQIRQLSREQKTKLWQYYAGKSSRFSGVYKALNKHEINAAIILSIESPAELCRFSGIPFSELERIINQPEYKHFHVEKKNGSKREICAPEKQLKRIQKRLNYYLQAYYLSLRPEAVHGFTVNPHYLGRNCNIVENAKPHTGKKTVLNIDLKDFFTSIKAWQVKDILVSEIFDYDDQIATAITLLTTHQGKLPTGSPTSPVLSNFICLDLDKELTEYGEKNGIAYTRYADDMTFSTDGEISEDEILDIINIIRNKGFQINEKKLRLKCRNRKQTVTGLTVNEKVNVNRKLLKKTRAMLHDLSKNGADIATRKHFLVNGEVTPKLRGKFIYRLEGYINFIGQVRGKMDPIYRRMKSEFDVIFEREDL